MVLSNWSKKNGICSLVPFMAKLLRNTYGTPKMPFIKIITDKRIFIKDIETLQGRILNETGNDNQKSMVKAAQSLPFCDSWKY